MTSVRGQGRFWAYEVQKVFNDITGRPISWGTLFPALRRLEVMGHLTSEWSSPHEEKRPIRYYCLTKSGKQKAAAAVVDATTSIPHTATTLPEAS